MNLQRLAIAALFTMAAGCQKPAPTGPNIVTAGNGVRQIRAEVAGPVWLKPDPEQITVNLTGHQLVLAKDRLLLDGTEVAPLNPAATKFDVSFSNNVLRVSTEGRKIWGTTLEAK